MNNFLFLFRYFAADTLGRMQGQLYFICQADMSLRPYRFQPTTITQFYNPSLSGNFPMLTQISPHSGSNFSKILYSFSLKRNVRQLLSVNESPEDIKSVHGIRALNAFMLLASHKSMAMFFNPYSNRTMMTEVK